MFCSTCGTAVNKSLNFCKNCGARVSAGRADEAEKLSESSFNLLVAAVLSIPIAGLGIIIALMSVMKDKLGFRNELILAFIFGAFLLLFVSEVALIVLLMSRHRLVKRGKDDDAGLKESAQLPDVVIKQVGGAKTRELVEPIPTVVDETTRSLETIAREPKMQ
jgi:predicted amidophosphoribosyltransferase